jgi:hypothetical protein
LPPQASSIGKWFLSQLVITKRKERISKPTEKTKLILSLKNQYVSSYWLERFDDLAQFVAHHGHLPRSKSETFESTLYLWMYDQKKRLESGELKDNQIALLVGFIEENGHKQKNKVKTLQNKIRGYYARS